MGLTDVKKALKSGLSSERSPMMQTQGKASKKFPSYGFFTTQCNGYLWDTNMDKGRVSRLG